MELHDLERAVIAEARAWYAARSAGRVHALELAAAVEALEEWHAHWEWRMTYTSDGRPNPILIDKTKETP